MPDFDKTTLAAALDETLLHLMSNHTDHPHIAEILMGGVTLFMGSVVAQLIESHHFSATDRQKFIALVHEDINEVIATCTFALKRLSIDEEEDTHLQN